MKAVLIIDMPKSCYDCQYCLQSATSAREYCGLAQAYTAKGLNPHNETDVCCPLRPLNKTVKAGDRNLIIYDRDYLYKNFDREIEFMKKAKEFYESSINN